MSKILVIHPKDNSTTFLENIYKDIPNITLITGGVNKSELIQLIREHDRVMMMGHGSPRGLFSVGQFEKDNTYFSSISDYIIDSDTVDALSEKDNNVFIWCNADQFVNHFNLKGFYTRMFISEVGEAYYCKVYGTQEMVDESNYGFVNMLSECISEPQEIMYEKITKSYGELAETNPVALYNWNRLCFNKP